MKISRQKLEARSWKIESSERSGVALVVTLLMLSVITFMTIAFLAVSRRERSSVSSNLNQVDAQAMADAALARAQADMAASLMAHNTNVPPGREHPSDLLNYDMMMSHNFINPVGFTPGINDPTNVNFDYHNDPTRTPMTNNQADWIENIANLLYDPRVPVFIQTNASSPNLDFRYWLDYNRNGRFESNGLLPVLDNLGNPVLDAGGNPITNSLIGEPEWIGVLRQPDMPHGTNNNTFIGRYAYLVLPIGKTLDLNYIHNYAKSTGGRTTMPAGINRDNFLRNQGHGPWEINMAGFLYGLNPTVWNTNYTYFLSTFPNQGNAFDDAYAFLRYRYNADSRYLRTLSQTFPTTDPNLFPNDLVDEMSDGPVVTSAFDAQYADGDRIDLGWPGSTNYNNFYEPQDIFDKLAGTPFNDRLTNALALNDTESRYTFSRMLASIGTDSDPELYCWVHDNDADINAVFRGTGQMIKRAKVNLNFANLNELRAFNKDPVHAKLTTPTVLTNWDALTFFTNTADLLLRSQDFEITVTNAAGGIFTNYIHFGIANIPIYSSTNHSVRYTEAIHRMLQLAANLYDANSNTVSANSAFPSVFRPLFLQTNVVANGVTATNVYIIGFTNVADTTFTNNPFKAFSQLSSNVVINLNDNVWGIPLIVGAKRGLPNFNEYSVSTAVVVERLLKFHRPTPYSRPDTGHQMYIYSITNLYGVELWNSYHRGFTNAVDVWITNAVNQAFVNEQIQSGTNVGQYSSFRVSTNFPVFSWPGTTNGVIAAQPSLVKSNTFVVLTNNVITLPTSQYAESKKQFDPDTSNGAFQYDVGYTNHDWRLMTTNYMFYLLTDRNTHKILDVVNIGDLTTATNIYPVLIGTGGLVNLNNTSDANAAAIWNTNGSTIIAGYPASDGVKAQIAIVTNNLAAADWKPQTQPGSATYFKNFMAGINTNGDTQLEATCPYQPNAILVFRHSYMANDPIVHYTTDDLRPNRDQQVDRKQPAMPLNMNYNLWQVNTTYSPWSNPKDPETDGKMIFKDPMITESEAWSFPSNKFANVGWIGRVHRGTPWQTVYLKSDDVSGGVGAAPPAYTAWTKNWTTSMTTYPTNDWRLLDLFTVAINENAARGLLSVNQTNLAPWSAVLSGVFVITNDNNGVVIDPTNVPPIVTALNNYRLTQDNQVFHHVGDILGVPQLTRTFLMPTNSGGVMDLVANEEVPPNVAGTHWDEVVERIPQSVFSLLKVGDPRFVIYAFGQSLKPANNSLVLGGQYRGMCTNYQITGEVVTRTVCRLSNDSTPSNPKIIVESFNILPGN